MESMCRLCGTPGKLCWSHILPEFLYRPLYDENHRYFVLTADVDRHRTLQRGLTEKLLCLDCEQRLGRYENYAADVMSGRLGHRYRKIGSRIAINDLNYRRFKLFQMSILWRGAVSSLDFFRLVSLGLHQERLHDMLLRDDPGQPHEFGCAVVFATERGEDISDTFFNPEPLRWCGRRMIKFFFAGSAWLFHCDKRPAPTYLQNLFLQPDGPLTGLTGDLAEARAYGPIANRIARRLRV
jgi:hypothetical protein